MHAPPPPAPADIASAVRQAVRETIAGTVRTWVEEITADELKSEAVRGQIRPMLVELVRQELQAALRPVPARNGHPKKR